MAGARQHYIPRSVQRGFVFNTKPEMTYVYRRDGSTFPSSIKDVAVRRYFYSHPSKDGSQTLDDLITAYENRLGSLLIQLRSIPIDGLVEPETAAEVIAHLTPRSANVRSMFATGMQEIMNATVDAFSEEDTIEKMLGLAEPEPTKTWRDNVAHIFDNDPQLNELLTLRRVPKSLLERMVFMAMKEYFVSGFDPGTLGITDAMVVIQSRLEEMVQIAHNNALGKSIMADSHKALLQALEWKIRDAPQEGAILPDCVALGLNDGKHFRPYMMTDRASLAAVVMPITSQKLLVGTPPGEGALDLTTFNHSAAACSDELFISSSQTRIFAELCGSIGERWKSEIDVVVQAAKRAVFPSTILADQPISSPLPKELSGFSLTFIGCGNEEDVSPVSEVIKRVVAHVMAIFDLERLDGITFASDHAAALNDLVRGFDTTTTPEWMPDYIAQGAATALVVRDNVLKVRIVLHASYAHALVADHEPRTMVALHFLVATIAQACSLKRIDTAVPGFLLTPVPMEDHDGVLHCALRQALRAYRYARDSVGFGADELVEQEYLGYLTAALANARGVIAQAKRDHATTPNFPALFRTAHKAASEILGCTARLLGHRHGVATQEEALTTNTEAGSAIAEPKLTGWVEAFSRDLQRFWQKDTWTRADFYALNIHVERVLWANGVFLWRDPNGQGTTVMAAPLENEVP